MPWEHNVQAEGGRCPIVPEVRDPVCGMTFPEEDAEALGAFVHQDRRGRHYFCSKTCLEEYQRQPAGRS